MTDVTRARLLLAGGSRPGEVFARLAVEADTPRGVRDAAVAVCLALGMPREEAEARVGSDAPGDWDLADPSTPDAAEYGRLLEDLGTFTAQVEYTLDQRRVVDLLDGAIGVARFVRSGLWHGYETARRSGRLRDAFVMLTRLEHVGRFADSPAYWTQLLRAADLLGEDGDADYLAAVARCRDHLAR